MRSRDCRRGGAHSFALFGVPTFLDLYTPEASRATKQAARDRRVQLIAKNNQTEFSVALQFSRALALSFWGHDKILCDLMSTTLSTWPKRIL